jgi:hypothetical protein
VAGCLTKGIITVVCLATSSTVVTLSAVAVDFLMVVDFSAELEVVEAYFAVSSADKIRGHT